MENTLFRSDERQHFIRCQRHTIDFVVPVGIGATQFGYARIGLIGMQIGSAGCFTHRVDGLL